MTESQNNTLSLKTYDKHEPHRMLWWHCYTESSYKVIRSCIMIVQDAIIWGTSFSYIPCSTTIGYWYNFLYCTSSMTTFDTGDSVNTFRLIVRNHAGGASVSTWTKSSLRTSFTIKRAIHSFNFRRLYKWFPRVLTADTRYFAQCFWLHTPRATHGTRCVW